MLLPDDTDLRLPFYSAQLRLDGTLLVQTTMTRGGITWQRMQFTVAQWCESAEIRVRRARTKRGPGEVIGSAYIPVRSLAWFCGRVPRRPLRDLNDMRDFVVERTQPFVAIRLRRQDGSATGYDIVMHLEYFPAETALAMAPIPPYPEIMWPARRGTHVSLYADAVMTRACARNTGASLLRDVHGRPFVPRSLWRDVHRTITSAKKFIYICGWSVWPELELIREGEASSDEETFAAGTGGGRVLGAGARRKLRVPLKDILFAKAREGVEVRVMVWDEVLSSPLFPEGMMATHDELVQSTFKDTAVVAAKVRRKGFRGVIGPGGHMVPADGRRPSVGFVANVQIVSQLTFSHHQKCIICDAEPPGGCVDGRRNVVAFVGGVDLTDGRYDVGSHPLFSTSRVVPSKATVASRWTPRGRKEAAAMRGQAACTPALSAVTADGAAVVVRGPHAGDFHNASLPGARAANGDPRQPWHDIHARVIGTAARDVLRNFIARWRRQVEKFEADGTPPSGYVYDRHRSVLREKDARRWLLSEEEEGEVAKRFSASQPFGSKGLWQCALVRSIESSSAVMTNVVTGGPERQVDSSYLRATLHAIRRARRFIYIENQYFIGASDKWRLSLRDREGAPNTVPTELVCRIVRAIRDGDAFHVYIVVPLWPEGDPHSGAVQEILCFQHSTVEYMYKAINEELVAQGLEGKSDPVDYLSILALCRRELDTRKRSSSSSSSTSSSSSSAAGGAAYTRRRGKRSRSVSAKDLGLGVGVSSTAQRANAGSRARSGRAARRGDGTARSRSRSPAATATMPFAMGRSRTAAPPGMSAAYGHGRVPAYGAPGCAAALGGGWGAVPAGVPLGAVAIPTPIASHHAVSHAGGGDRAAYATSAYGAYMDDVNIPSADYFAVPTAHLPRFPPLPRRGTFVDDKDTRARAASQPVLPTPYAPYAAAPVAGADPQPAAPPHGVPSHGVPPGTHVSAIGSAARTSQFTTPYPHLPPHQRHNPLRHVLAGASGTPGSTGAAASVPRVGGLVSGRHDADCDCQKGSVKKAVRSATVRRYRRFPIYVHSKLLIVDDDVIMVGSVGGWGFVCFCLCPVRLACVSLSGGIHRRVCLLLSMWVCGPSGPAHMSPFVSWLHRCYPPYLRLISVVHPLPTIHTRIVLFWQWCVMPSSPRTTGAQTSTNVAWPVRATARLGSSPTRSTMPRTVTCIPSACSSSASTCSVSTPSSLHRRSPSACEPFGRLPLRIGADTARQRSPWTAMWFSTRIGSRDALIAKFISVLRHCSRISLIPRPLL